MERLKESFRSVFDEMDDAAFRPDQKLGHIAGWDSMRGVSLLMQLETDFNVKLTKVSMGPDQTVGDVVSVLRERGVNDL